MKTDSVRSIAVLAITLLAAAILTAQAQASDFLDQDWVLNPRLSNVYMQTVKKNEVFETHQFNAVEGGVDADGSADIKIELESIDTHHDLRNVRMRFLLFETFKFPNAEITAKINRSKLSSLEAQTRMAYLLDFTVRMHGFEKEFQAPVWVTLINDSTVSVATIKPVIVDAKDFGLDGNVGKLAELVGGILIAPAASITFDLVFGAGEAKSELVTARAEREKTRAKEASDNISAEACENRLEVISETNAIHFRSGSAQLDEKSRPLLESLADIANRCPEVEKISVEGHTDAVGPDGANQRLSEQRAEAVVSFLKDKGVEKSRIESAGFGASRPVAANDTETNRAKNRRIEFKVKK
ncbi:MAG: OmpA family protein [Alphaproteobacteria bacterium]|nr:OmpA family protein [Alphaproteobacteria bacterium]